MKCKAFKIQDPPVITISNLGILYKNTNQFKRDYKAHTQHTKNNKNHQSTMDIEKISDQKKKKKTRPQTQILRADIPIGIKETGRCFNPVIVVIPSLLCTLLFLLFSGDSDTNLFANLEGDKERRSFDAVDIFGDFFDRLVAPAGGDRVLAVATNGGPLIFT